MKLIQKDLADLDQKILLLRLDLNVPIKNEKIQEAYNWNFNRYWDKQKLLSISLVRCKNKLY